MKFTAIGVRNLKERGLHGDGRGLYLSVRGNSKSWIFRYTFNGKPRHMGLGPLHAVSLAQARALAEEAREIRRSGLDPLEEREVRKKTSVQQTVAGRVRAFAAAGMAAQCSLYRHYDVEGNLLYVGISLEPLRRQRKHLGSADWRKAIFQIVIEPFATSKEALEAEESAVRNEHPKHNATHNRHRQIINELKYLEPKP